jgi:hypothetical protein
MPVAVEDRDGIEVRDEPLEKLLAGLTHEPGEVVVGIADETDGMVVWVLYRESATMT